MAAGLSKTGGLPNTILHIAGVENSQVLTAGDIGCHNVISVNHFHGFSEPPNQVDKVLSWLEPHSADYFPAHEEARSRRTPGTGRWFFDTQIYSDWATKESIELRNLECIGIPGAGKTTLASGTIDDLRRRYASARDSSIVLYVYFRHDTQSLQKIPNVFASLLRQVVKKRKQVSEELQDLYEEYSSNPEIVPAADKTIKILQLELMAYRTTFIIIDALDEYMTDSYSHSHALVSQLERLDARLLITSRHQVDFTPNTFSSLDIYAHAEDIRIFVEQHVTGNLAKIIARIPSLMEEIVTTVITKAEGMFIIAKLLIEAIPHLYTAVAIRASLTSLPTGLHATYLMTMTRICEQESHTVELAKMALCWVYFAKRHLSVQELQHAVSFQHGETMITEESLITEDALRSTCLGLIVYVKDKEGVLRYFTTKEFFDECWQDYFPDGEKQVTETCLEYLTVAVSSIPSDVTERVIHSSDPDDDDEWQEYRTSTFALCVYAASLWGAHAKAIDETLDLYAGAKFFAYPISPYVADGNETQIYTSTTMSPAHYWTLYCARFGLLKHLQMCTRLLAAAQNQYCDDAQTISIDFDEIEDQLGWTAIHFAAFNGHAEVTEFMLDNGVDINLLDDDGISPLHDAAMAGISGLTTVQLLLNRGADVDQPDSQWKRAPIYYAIAAVHGQPSLEAIRLLLQREVDIHREDYRGNTPLSLAQQSEDPEIRQLFEEHARTHPPKPRAYRQHCPGESTSASISECEDGMSGSDSSESDQEMNSQAMSDIEPSESAYCPAPAIVSAEIIPLRRNRKYDLDALMDDIPLSKRPRLS